MTKEKNAEKALEYPLDHATESHHIVLKYTLGSIAIAAIPLPLIDLVAVTSMQVKMVHSISSQYEVPFSSDRTKSIIAALTGGLVTVSAIGSISSLVKVIPVVGHIVGFVGGAATYGAITYAIGKVFIMHFESGGTFLDFKAADMRDHFQRFFEEGQEFVKEQREKIKPTAIK